MVGKYRGDTDPIATSAESVAADSGTRMDAL
jgi:hypothetical protein